MRHYILWPMLLVMVWSACRGATLLWNRVRILRLSK